MEDNYQIEQKYYKVLPIKNTVMFPGILLPIAVSKKNSLKLIRAAEKSNETLILLTQKDNKAANPTENELHTVGTFARVIQIIPVPEMGKDTMMTIFEGYHRVQAVDFQNAEDGTLEAHAFEMDEHMPLKNDKQFKGTLDTIRETVLEILSKQEGAPAGLQSSLKNLTNSPSFLNYVCAVYHLPTETKQELLEIHDLTERANAVLTILQKDLEELNIKEDIRRRTAEKIDKRNREFFLQQEMETIKKDLGDNDDKTVIELRERAKDKKWSKTVAEQFENEV